MIIYFGQRHSFFDATGDMEKQAVLEIDAHMAVTPARFEEHQITCLQVFSGNGDALSDLLCRRAGQDQAELVFENAVNQTGTINPAFIQAAESIRGCFPLLILGIKFIDNS